MRIERSVSIYDGAVIAASNEREKTENRRGATDGDRGEADGVRGETGGAKVQSRRKPRQTQKSKK